MDIHLWLAITFTIMNLIQLVILGITLFVPGFVDKAGSITFLIVIAFMILIFILSVGYLIYNLVA